jgi:hypothetical protein
VPIRHQFTGRVDGANIGGTADLSAPKLQARTDWNAMRSGNAAAAAGASTALLH